MSESKPYVSPPPEADGNYKYYLVAGRPVRVTCDERGIKRFAEAPDPANGGALAIVALLNRIMKDELDVEESTKAEFVELCQKAVSKYGRT